MIKFIRNWVQATIPNCRIRKIFWTKFIPFAGVLIITFVVFSLFYRDKAALSQFLIVGDVILSLLIACCILLHDLEVYTDSQNSILSDYGCNLTEMDTVDYRSVLNVIIWILSVLAILYATLFFSFASYSKFEHLELKLFKFAISQVIMIGSVMIFAELTIQCIIEKYEKSLVLILRGELVR